MKTELEFKVLIVIAGLLVTMVAIAILVNCCGPSVDAGIVSDKKINDRWLQLVIVPGVNGMPSQQHHIWHPKSWRLKLCEEYKKDVCEWHSVDPSVYLRVSVGDNFSVE